jgi:hypothetical protein
MERAERVGRVASATYQRGGQVALVVLTASHSADAPLADFKALVQQASGKARKGKAWVQATERHRILGVVVGQEITLSRRHGPHYHQHLSIPVDGPTEAERAAAGGDEEALAELVRARAQAAGMAVAERYKAAIRAAGGKVSDEHGVRVRVADDEDDASGYTSKGSLAWEVAGGPTKDETKDSGSLTPWDVAELAYAGDGWARARWAEYVEVMPGTRSCVVSAALARALDLDPADDRQEGEQVLHEPEEIVGRVEAQTWRRWLRHGLGSTFLARVEYGGQAGFAAAVTRTDEQANEMEAIRAARQADKEVRKARRDHDEALAEAVDRVHAAPGAGTRARVRRVVAAMSAERPDRPPPDEAAIIAGLVGSHVVDLGLAA